MGTKLIINEGQRFGRLTVAGEVNHVSGRRYFKTICDCGNTCEVRLDGLTRGTTTSCGCYQKDAVTTANTKHGCYKSNIYHVWEAMIQRCTNNNNPSFKHYGARGITVCEEWKNFSSFNLWAEGKYKNELEIERINNNGNYCPENCKFDTRSAQCYNRRNFKNTSGKTGVGWDESKNKWVVYIGKVFIGRYSNFENAVEARKKAEIEVYGFNLEG